MMPSNIPFIERQKITKFMLIEMHVLVGLTPL